MSMTIVPTDQLLPLIDNEGHPNVSGRVLHNFLEVETQYNKWFPRMVEYGFAEGTDFWTFLSESSGGRPSADHHLTMDMAKELSMLQRTERGREARRYFIEAEKLARQAIEPLSLEERALALIGDLSKEVEAQKIENQRQAVQIEESKPYVARAKTYQVSAREQGRREFAREVCKWARDHAGAVVTQNEVHDFLGKKLHLFIVSNTKDHGHATADAEKRGLTVTEKGTTGDGHNWAAGRLTAKGQEYAWKRIVAHIEEHGTLTLKDAA